MCSFMLEILIIVFVRLEQLNLGYIEQGVRRTPASVPNGLVLAFTDV